MFARYFPHARSVLLFSVVVCWLCLFATEAYPQVVGATLSGTITDPSGGVVPNAMVSARNTATGVTREVTADTAGLYVLPNLLPGAYEVTVTAPGFSTTRQSNLELAVGAAQQLNFSLKVGETTQTVQVTEAVPMVQATSSTLTSEVESTTVRELPLNGRDWASLATLSPGVTGLNGEVQLPFESGALRGNRGFGSQLTISGGRPTQNNYRLDGLSISDYTNGSGSVMGATLGVDAIQEFSVITGNYSAEYGRTSGGVINAISKSGTNAFHGDVYEFWRNDALDANDFFSNRNGQPLPTLRRNQFGAAAGGPIIKDRTFIFGDYEGIRLAEGTASGNSNVLSENARKGLVNFPKGPSTFPTGCVQVDPTDCQLTVDPNAAKYVALYPHPNGPVTANPNVATFVFAPTRRVTENFVTVRGDHRFSDKDSLFATYNFDNSPFTTPDGFDTISVLSGVKRNLAALEWTHTLTPTLLNTARLGYNRNDTTNNLTTGTTGVIAGYSDPSLSMMPGFDAPGMIVSGLSRTSNGLPGGFTYFRWNSLQFYDDAFLTRGTHSLKFGFAVENMRYNPFTEYLPNGLIRSSLVGLLTNKINSFEAGLPINLGPRGYRETLFGGYVQDDWHWRHNLTLNIGLRYEASTTVSEQYGKLTSLRSLSDPLPFCGTSAPSVTDAFLGKPGCAGVKPITSNPTLHNFEPRIGFAWDPRGNGKMAVRGGYAIFDVLPLPGYFFSQAWAPFFLTTTLANKAALAGTMGVAPLNAAGAPNPGSAYSLFALPQAGCASPLGNCTLTASYTEPNPKRNYVQQWNINFQRQLTPSLTATVGYVGSHGVHQLIRGDDFNMVVPCPPACGAGSVQIPGRTAWPLNTTPAMKVNPDFGTIRGLSWGTSSSYEAFQLNVQKRMSHGFQFGGSYTYGKSMDSDSGTILGDAFSNSITTWFWFDPSLSWAPSDYNITHNGAINAIWDIPGPKSLGGVGGTLLNGWEVGSILKLNSGIPTTPLINDDAMGVLNAGSDGFGIPDRVPGCDPINHNYKSDPKLTYINTNCFTVPMVAGATASQCRAFTSVPGSCANVLGNAGRNSIYGPGLFNVDFSLYKNFPLRGISESASLQFRAEFFNILNRPNFGAPLDFQGGKSAQIFDVQTGLPTGAGNLANPTVTKPREGQLALKLIW
jgi:Carboxypeptidase regulatory-like domain/TonB-dependent Receptor Plug Domain/TonB dependent receptor